MPASKHKNTVIEAALELAKVRPYTEIRRIHLAEKTELSLGSVSAAVGTMTQFRRSLMRAAIRAEVLPVIALGLALGDPHALKAPDELRARAANSLTN